MFQLFILIVTFAFNAGFLLDGQNPQISGTTPSKGHYLTIDDKIEIIHDLEKIRDEVRNEQKNTINILTSQMRQRLEDIERQIKSDTGNTSCQNKIALIENYVRVLEKNNTDLSRKLDSLQLSFMSSQNETKELTRQLKSLKELQGIQQLNTLKTVQEKVRTLDSSVHSLLNNELARNQDFLALHNITTNSVNLMNELEKGTRNKFLTLESLEVKHGNSIDSIYNKTIQSESRISTLENTITANISSLKEHQILTQDNKRVALTACGGSSSISSGTAIKFDSVKSSYGISNLASFKSTGYFTCETPGLYLISAVIMTGTPDANVYIYKNSNRVIYAYINYNLISSSPAVLVTELQVGDTIKIAPAKTMYVYSDRSCVTIVKVA